MTAQNKQSDQERQCDSLLLEIQKVRQQLLAYIGEDLEKEDSDNNTVIENQTSTTRLDRLCTLFGITSFEKSLLLLCLAMEVYQDFSWLCAKAQGDSQKNYPTLALAINLFNEDKQLLLTTEASLRYWQILEVQNGISSLNAPLRINERIFHYLLGDNSVDKQLLSWLKPMRYPMYDIPTHIDLAKKIYQNWLSQSQNSLVCLTGSDISSKQNVALLSCALRNLNLVKIEVQGLSLSTVEVFDLTRNLFREALLNDFVYFIDYGEPSLSENFSTNLNAIMQLVYGLGDRCILSTFEHFKYDGIVTYNVEVNKPLKDEQKNLWKILLENSEEYSIDQLISNYNLDIADIFEISNLLAAQKSIADQQLLTDKLLWEICSQHSRKQLHGLAKRIECKAAWADIVLPETYLQTLKELTFQVKQRHKVYHEWGFSEKGSRGLGISALFAGPSGTGKTLAAEVIAKELKVDLYQIDLSTVVSKYIGETEKNLQKIFKLAEGSGAILLFDEADSLFGKRSEVKDSHDRYANMEVSYLLQRMEAYQGLSILTTNFRSALDQAFLRRLRFIVNFPFPEREQREGIWRHIFPQSVPLHDIDYFKLSSLNITGSNIRSIALNAAFIAAEEGESIHMQHLLRAAQNEYLKLGRTLNISEFN